MNGDNPAPALDISETDDEAMARFRLECPGYPEEVYAAMLAARNLCLRWCWREVMGP